MRLSNIAALLAVALWVAVFALGRGVVYAAIPQQLGKMQVSGSVDHYVVGPLLIALAVTGTAWFANAARKGFVLLGCVSAAALLLLIPTMFVFTGGM